ncbi:MAG: hypothetical protein GY928_11265 [Colwellia sp.]|nr:hypothetical protein [Colwellia sp.]
MSITKINSSSRVTEFDSTIKGIITAYEQSSFFSNHSSDQSSDKYLTDMFSELKPHSNNLTISINGTKPENNQEELDSVRDEKVRGGYYLLQGYAYHPSKAVQEAAVVVNAIFEEFGVGIVNESHAVESSLINALLARYAEPSVAEQIAILPGMAQLVEELRNAQDAFEQARLALDTATAQGNIDMSASELKKEMLKLVNGKLTIYLQAMAIVD